ncbi:MAG: RluA family pseudouridine synthase [Cyanobacteria bacterium J06643_4]
MNQGWTYCDRISKSAVGQTILSYYTQRYRHSTQAQWQTRIEQGQIRLDGQLTHPQNQLANGQQLTYHRLPWEEPSAPLNFDILYEDDHLWVIAKPSGLPVLPGGGFLEHTLLHQLRLRYPDEQPIPVHRLGRGTSGAMLIAKSQTARAHLARQFRIRSSPQDAALNRQSRTLTKIYRALVTADINKQTTHFTCTYPIGKLPHDQLGYIYAHQPEGGLPSRSDCTIVQRRPDATLLDVSISTGRPHQIRIHLAAAGHPLLGDPLYPIGGIPAPTGTAMPGDCGYHLHAHQLRFIHPHTGHPIAITAPPPQILSI